MEGGDADAVVAYLMMMVGSSRNFRIKESENRAVPTPGMRGSLLSYLVTDAGQSVVTDYVGRRRYKFA